MRGIRETNGRKLGMHPIWVNRMVRRLSNHPQWWWVYRVIKAQSCITREPFCHLVQDWWPIKNRCHGKWWQDMRELWIILYLSSIHRFGRLSTMSNLRALYSAISTSRIWSLLGRGDQWPTRRLSWQPTTKASWYRHRRPRCFSVQRIVLYHVPWCLTLLVNMNGIDLLHHLYHSTHCNSCFSMEKKLLWTGRPLIQSVCTSTCFICNWIHSLYHIQQQRANLCRNFNWNNKMEQDN